MLTDEIINDIIMFNSIEKHNCNFKEMFEGLFLKILMNFVVLMLRDAWCLQGFIMGLTNLVQSLGKKKLN
jgi:hypothetical protein